MATHVYLYFVFILVTTTGLDSSLDQLTRLRTGQSVFRFPAGTREVSLVQNVQTNSETHPALYSVPTEDKAARA